MVIDFSREASKIYAAWNDRYFDFKEEFDRHVLYICGEYGAGKTAAIQAYVRAHKKTTRYFSFAGLTGSAAIAAFASAFQLEKENPASWDEAGRLFGKQCGNHALHVILDDLDGFAQQQAFWKGLLSHLMNKHIVFSEVQRCTREDYLRKDPGFASFFIGRRTLADYCKYFPDYTKQDILRLFSMTGGALTILQELDEQASPEDNLRTLLRYDSAFSRFVPEWLGEHFRSPESYYPILCAIAEGRCRLSEIARAAGYPNNKCQTYLRSLVKAQLVRTEKQSDRKYVAYRLTNSAVAAWCLFVYRHRSQQISDPDALLRTVMENIDEKLAIPEFRQSCFRYLMYSRKGYLREVRYMETLKQAQDVRYRFKDGSSLKLDYYLQVADKTLVAIMPERMDRKYTKEDILRIREAVDCVDTLAGTDIVVFSLHRFSDWCVHEASEDDLLHLVTMERLKC